MAPEPTTALDFGSRLLRSLAYLVVVTVPLVALGVLGGALLLPYVGHLTSIGAVLGIAGVALVSVLVALPTFFEIPLALVLLQAGAPAGAAVALLVAGPIVNLPSLLVVARETHPRLAAALALAVWAVATVTGVLVSF